MEKIYLSDSGPKVSPAVYGFYRWKGNYVNEDKMEQILNLCLELDINTFDHGDTYGDDTCEEIFGNVLRRSGIKREIIVLFTKCGLNIPNDPRPYYSVNHFDTSIDHIASSAVDSVRHLKAEYVDVLLVN